MVYALNKNVFPKRHNVTSTSNIYQINSGNMRHAGLCPIHVTYFETFPQQAFQYSSYCEYPLKI